MAIFGAIGALAGGVFGAIGDEEAASQYRKAARYEQGAAVLTGQQFFPTASATWMQEQQLMHQVYGTIGTAASQITGGNLKIAGSGQEILKGSMRQGAAANAAIVMKGKMQMNDLQAKVWSEAQQIEMDKSMAKKEETAAIGSIAGGVFGALGGVFKGLGGGGGGDTGEVDDSAVA